jgi:hypothetical protein
MFKYFFASLFCMCTLSVQAVDTVIQADKIRVHADKVKSQSDNVAAMAAKGAAEGNKAKQLTQ